MKMRDSELVNLIARESRQSIGVEDSFAADRERAMEFYMGEAKGELSAPGV